MHDYLIMVQVGVTNLMPTGESLDAWIELLRNLNQILLAIDCARHFESAMTIAESSKAGNEAVIDGEHATGNFRRKQTVRWRQVGVAPQSIAVLPNLLLQPSCGFFDLVPVHLNHERRKPVTASNLCHESCVR